MAYIKGNGSRSSSGGSRGRPYGMILLLAFGTALLGVLILHKLRERSIFNLLLKEKDHDIFSLHLLHQKEREYVKEVKRKNDEMKAKIYSLRTQKMELNRRLIKMQSAVDSLKDEQTTMEASTEDKQNEIRMLRQQDQMGTTERGNNDPQVMALLERLKQKEAEIQNLKRRLEYPAAKVWSVSADEPSKPSVNQTAGVAGDQKGETAENVEKLKRSQDVSANKATNHGEGAATRSIKNENGNEVGRIDHERPIMKQQIEKSDDLKDRTDEKRWKR